jgi:hypothetical protein
MEDFIMKTPKISLLQWQKRFGTEKACAATLLNIVGHRDLCVQTAAMIQHTS